MDGDTLERLGLCLVSMRWLSWLGVVIVCALVAVALGFYKYNSIQAAIAVGAAFPEPVEAVEVYVVREVAHQSSMSVPGEVVATQRAMLQNELKGRIVDVGFVPGAMVEKGQMLLLLDTGEEKAQLAEAIASQAIARLALDRAQRLVTNGAGSLEARDRATAQFHAAGARVDALTARIDKKTLRAPFNALTGLHELEVGQYLEAGTEITELVGVSDTLWVDFSLPQDHVSIEVGNTVEVSIEGIGQSVSALVIARDAAINIRSRNLRLRAQLRQAHGLLLPGMLVRVLVPLDEARMRTMVPPTAVRRDALGASVFVLEDVDEQGVAKIRARRQQVILAQVRQADLDEDFVVVLDGLSVGQKIAAIGAFKLRNGALVATGEPEPDIADRIVGR